MAITVWDDQQASTWQSICDSTVNKMKKRWEYDLKLHSQNPTISGNRSKHSSWLTMLIFHSENPLENYGVQLTPLPLGISESLCGGGNGYFLELHICKNTNGIEIWEKYSKKLRPNLNMFLKRSYCLYFWANTKMKINSYVWHILSCMYHPD